MFFAFVFIEAKFVSMNEEKELFCPDTERIDEINENLHLIQRRDGLTFGTDAYLLAAFAGAKRNGRAADLGCGTGVISLLCASRGKFTKLYAFELQDSFASLAGRNAALNGLSDVITVKHLDIRNVTERDTDGTVDCVMMNPPYLKDGSGHESRTDEMSIARRELNGTIYDFCVAASRILRFGGTLSVVHRPERLVDVIDAMRKSGIEPKNLITVYPDQKSEPCLVLIDGRKGGSPSIAVHRPLIIYKSGTREYTADMQRIYDCFTLEHIMKRRGQK